MADAELSLSFPTPDVMHTVYEAEIKHGGLIFDTKAEVAANSTLQVRFDLPNNCGQVEFTARVVLNQSVGDGDFRVAIDLSAINAEHKALIETSTYGGKLVEDAKEQVKVVWLDGRWQEQEAEGHSTKSFEESHPVQAKEAKKQFILAREKIVQGNLKMALDHLRQATQIHPNNKQYLAVMREMQRKVTQEENIKRRNVKKKKNAPNS